MPRWGHTRLYPFTGVHNAHCRALSRHHIVLRQKTFPATAAAPLTAWSLRARDGSNADNHKDHQNSSHRLG